MLACVSGGEEQRTRFQDQVVFHVSPRPSTDKPPNRGVKCFFGNLQKIQELVGSRQILAISLGETNTQRRESTVTVRASMGPTCC